MSLFTLLQTDADNPDIVVGFICLRVGFNSTNVLNNFHTPHDSTEHGVFVVQPWSWNHGNKKLTTVCVWSSIGHAQCVWSVVL